MFLFQAHVGFLIVLWFLVRSLDLALTNIERPEPYPRWPWTVAYFILVALLLIALFLGAH